MEGLFTVLSVPRVGQVHLFYRARLLSDRFDPGHETIEARLFSEDEIPWEEIAFKTVSETLLCYFEDRRRGRVRGAQHRHRLAGCHAGRDPASMSARTTWMPADPAPVSPGAARSGPAADLPDPAVLAQPGFFAPLHAQRVVARARLVAMFGQAELLGQEQLVLQASTAFAARRLAA